MTITHTFQSAKSDGADTTVVQPSDWNAAHTIAEGYTLLRVASVTLTDAQIKAQPTTPAQIIAAPGAEKMLVIIGGLWIKDTTAGAYTGLDSGDVAMVLIYGNTPGSNYASKYAALTLGNADTIVQTLTPNAASQSYAGITPEPIFDLLGNSVSDYENKGLYAYFENGDNLTGGNAANTLKVTVYYMVVDL
jgi:hypothetical protein